ncbi:MAG: hypothetical protein ACOYYS_00045 [Chloroflexota bacterium]
MLLIAVILLFVTAAVMVVLRLLRRPIFWHWITALLGGLTAWGLAIVVYFRLPYTVSLLTWQLPYDFSAMLTLRVDILAWPYAVAIAVLPPVIVLTALARRSALYWRPWAGCLLITAIGLGAVCAGNAFTLLLAWASLDLIEILVLFAQGSQINLARNAALAFVGRACGNGLVMLAILLAGAQALDFAAIPAASVPYLLLAAVLRLGILPFAAPFYFDEVAIRRGLGTALRLVPAASGLMLLTRTAVTGMPQAGGFLPGFPLQTVLLVLVVVTALIGSLAWAIARDELSGRLVWILSLGSLATAAAVLQLPEAALAWGLACLFSGGMILLHSVHGRGLWLFPVSSALAFSGLPFTPGWSTAALYRAPAGWSVFFWLVHGLLLFGFVRHALLQEGAFDRSQRWVGLLYMGGLGLLLGSQVLVGYCLPQPRFGVAWWAGAVSVAVAALLGSLVLWAMRRGWRFSQTWVLTLQRLFSLDWLYRLMALGYRLVERMMGLVSQLLEGEGGLLWVFILVGLLVTLYLNLGGDLDR